jgi:hypothetical protein
MIIEIEYFLHQVKLHVLLQESDDGIRAQPPLSAAMLPALSKAPSIIETESNHHLDRLHQNLRMYS